MTTKLRTKGAIAWAGAWGLVLALFAGQALALGLGRIEVKSQRNQPLLAEIQVISSNPAELDQLQARLASPLAPQAQVEAVATTRLLRV